MENSLSVKIVRDYIFTTQFASIPASDLKMAIANYLQEHPNDKEAAELLNLMNKDSAQYYYCALSTLGQLNRNFDEYIIHRLYNELALRLVYCEVPYAEIEYNHKTQLWSLASGGLSADLSRIDIWTCRRLEGYSTQTTSFRDLEQMMTGAFMMKYTPLNTISSMREVCESLNRSDDKEGWSTVSGHLWMTGARIYDLSIVAIPRAQVYELLNAVAQQCVAYSTIYYKALAECISKCLDFIRMDSVDYYYMLKNNYRLFEMLNVDARYCEFFLSCLGVRAYSYSRIRYESRYNSLTDTWQVVANGYYLHDTQIITFAQYQEYLWCYKDSSKILRHIEYNNQLRYRGELKALLLECVQRNQHPKYFRCNECGIAFCGISDTSGVCPVCRFKQIC